MHSLTNLFQRIEATDAKMKMTMTALFVLIEAMDGVDSAGKWAGNEKTTNEAATRRQQTTRKLKLPKVDRESKCKLIMESWKGCIPLLELRKQAQKLVQVDALEMICNTL